MANHGGRVASGNCTEVQEKNWVALPDFEEHRATCTITANDAIDSLSAR
jgi:hypothetical protein